MPAGHQIFFLRSFVNLRKHDAKVLDLVEYGLDTIIRETEYTPRAKDLAELCAQPFLSKVEDTDRMRKLVARFDSQLGLVAKAAHSRDLTVLQMRLAAAEYQYDKLRARDRIEQAYFDVSDIRTPEVQMECLALTLGALRQMDKDGELEAGDGFRAVVKDDLNKLIEVILKNAGDHLAAVSPVLRILAGDDFIAALELAGRLNTESRRNSAYATVASVIVSQPYREPLLQGLQTALGSITNLGTRSQATLGLLGALDANSARADWLPHVGGLRPNLTNPKAHGKWDVWMMKASVAAGFTSSPSKSSLNASKRPLRTPSRGGGSSVLHRRRSARFDGARAGEGVLRDGRKGEAPDYVQHPHHAQVVRTLPIAGSAVADTTGPCQDAR